MGGPSEAEGRDAVISCQHPRSSQALPDPLPFQARIRERLQSGPGHGAALPAGSSESPSGPASRRPGSPDTGPCPAPRQLGGGGAEEGAGEGAGSEHRAAGGDGRAGTRSGGERERDLGQRQVGGGGGSGGGDRCHDGHSEEPYRAGAGAGGGIYEPSQNAQ